MELQDLIRESGKLKPVNNTVKDEFYMRELKKQEMKSLEVQKCTTFGPVKWEHGRIKFGIFDFNDSTPYNEILKEYMFVIDQFLESMRRTLKNIDLAKPENNHRKRSIFDEVLKNSKTYVGCIKKMKNFTWKVN